jgi:tol-pal system protein YbgF
LNPDILSSNLLRPELIRGSLAEKIVMASLVLAIIFFATAPAAVMAQEAEQSVAANLVIQVQELQDELRELRGRMEEQERELDNLKKRQRDQYLDLDQRISDLSGAAPGGQSPTASDDSTGTAPDPEQAGAQSGERPEEQVGERPEAQPETPSEAQFEDVPEVRAPMEQPSDTAPLSQPGADSAVVAAPSEAEKESYDKAFQAMKELRYADAAEDFQSFLTQYPESEYADNAVYWLGESYYVTRNYDIALESFERLMDDYPDSPKVPDALLKVGYTHYELKQWDKARAALLQVQQDYPDTTLARLAESRLRSMKMEGHY